MALISLEPSVRRGGGLEGKDKRAAAQGVGLVFAL
jgi:hypothetical protein